jgi:hypothetical protein
MPAVPVQFSPNYDWTSLRYSDKFTGHEMMRGQSGLDKADPSGCDHLTYYRPAIFRTHCFSRTPRRNMSYPRTGLKLHLQAHACIVINLGIDDPNGPRRHLHCGLSALEILANVEIERSNIECPHSAVCRPFSASISPDLVRVKTLLYRVVQKSVRCRSI